MISREQEQRAEAIFMDAIALLPQERSRLFDERCKGDVALRAHLEELFALHDEATHFLESPPSVIGDLEMRYEDFSPGKLEHPELIGQFTIKGVLGKGGMGVVYLAESQRPRRLVALKVIRADAASRSMLRRFEHEAQVLALLKHRGIAQVYETGVVEEAGGRRPYFAMELVDGVSLTQYAARHDLGTRARLALMARICDAVQHAHMKGVVHRDLKPGNILVTEDADADTGDASGDAPAGAGDAGRGGGQGEGQPKILDFGVARLTDADVQVTTMQTDVGQLIGTIAYMSPEQVTGDPSAVDTRSDVYALGVILYELLTGELPHRVRNVAITEAIRTIREDEPTPLSTTNRLLRGDVDTIVRKALEKEPARRYQTAAELGADIRRYLNDEPISARPPSTAYQLRKFARRNRALVGGVAATFLVLVLGVMGTTWMAVVATRQANRAMLKSNISNNKDELTQDLLGRIAHAVESGEGESIPEILEAYIQSARLRFADRPVERAAAEHTVGRFYWILNDFGPAREHLTTALDLYHQLDVPEDRDALRTMAMLSGLAVDMGDLAGAEAFVDEASRLATRLPPLDEARLDVAYARADYLFEAGRAAEAERVLSDLAVRQRALADAGDARAEAELIQTMRRQAAMIQKQGRLEEALPLYREVLQRRRDRPDMGPSHFDTLIAMDAVASVLRDIATEESFAEAERLLEEAHAGLARTLGPEHFSTTAVRRNTATLLRARATGPGVAPEQRDADLARAQQILEEVVALERQHRDDRHPRTLLALNNLVAVQFDRARTIDSPAEKIARFGEAAATFTSIAEARRQTLGEDHLDTLHALNNAARVLLFQSRAMRAGGQPPEAVEPVLARAEALQREAVAAAGRTLGDDDWMKGHFEDRYAEILQEMGRLEQAAEHAVRAVRILEASYGPDHQRTQEARRRRDQLNGVLEASGAGG